jgi:hypothetical protein
LKELNARTWSQESTTIASTTQQDQVSLPQAPAPEEKSEASPLNDTFDIDGDLVADGFFFHEPVVVEQPKQFPPRYSPPSKRHVVDSVDKWAALGERRRAHATSPDTKMLSGKLRRHDGFSFYHGHEGGGFGLWDASSQQNLKWNQSRTVVRDCPRTRGRDWNWRKENRHDFGDVEWVGHWQEAH